MNQTFKKIVSGFFLAIFIAASTPDDLIHLLTNHYDTVDQHNDVTAISIRHIHCRALQLTLPAFSESTFYSLPSTLASCSQTYFHVELAVIIFFSPNSHGRAPPSVA